MSSSMNRRIFLGKSASGAAAALAASLAARGQDAPSERVVLGIMGLRRGANLATQFASLPGVTLPCDISATDRYFNPDITEPAFALGPESTLAVPDGYGVGVEVQRDRLEEAAARWRKNYPYKQ